MESERTRWEKAREARREKAERLVSLVLLRPDEDQRLALLRKNARSHGHEFRTVRRGIRAFSHYTEVIVCATWRRK